MKISRETFDKGFLPEKDVVKKQDHPVLAFLRKNYRHSFNIVDIMKATKLSYSTCSIMLKIFEKQKLVESAKMKNYGKRFFRTVARRKKVNVSKVVKTTKSKTAKKRK